MTHLDDDLTETLLQLQNDADFVNLRFMTGVKVKLKYATPDNFMRTNVYRSFSEPFLHQLAADKLREAVRLLHQERPACNFLVFDALRPRSIQRLLWSHVVGTNNQGYVANPDKGSMHNYGCAIDLTIQDHQGHELDMGTPFDTFHPLSQPSLEALHLQKGTLTQAQLDNRMVLRRAMTGAGFLQLSHEWWHYDAFTGEEVRRRFRIIE